MNVTSDFEYDGKTGQVYKIWIVNILLSILTLGIYRFWGKTRMRKYTTGSFALKGDRFEYTGSGKELFWGFVKAALFIIIISIPFFWAVYQLESVGRSLEETQQAQTQSPSSDIPELKKPEDRVVISGDNQKQELSKVPSEVLLKNFPEELYIPTIVYFLYLIFYIAFIPYVAKFQALRYRAARLQWRGVRAHLSGSAIWYGIIGFFNTLLMVTVLWKPFGDLLLLKYKVKRLKFGDLQGSLDGMNYAKVFLMFVGSILMFIISLFLIGFVISLIMAFLFGGSSPEELKTLVHNDPKSLVTIVLIICSASLMYLLPIYFYLVYKAAVNRQLYNHLKFGSIGFSTNMNGKNLFGYYFVNFIILLFTLGLGYPLIIQRKQKFIQKHIKVIGDLDTIQIEQATGKKYKTGEGLFAFFDLRISLF